MKAIKLTKEHKKKLLKMCKTLFPEYKNWDLKLEGEYKNHLIASFEEDNDYIPNCDLYIHWFEFCMTHLIDKLSIEFAKSEGEDDSCLKEEFLFHLSKIKNKIHPVDYLYKEFLKLKK